MGMRRINPDQMTRVFVLIFGGIGVLFLGLGMIATANNVRYANAIEVPGTVVAHEARSDSDGTTYALVVSYVDEAGRTREITSNYSTSSPAKIGSEVPVQYLPGKPDSVRIATWMGKWFLATLFTGMGGIFAVIAGAVYGTFVTRMKPRPDAPVDEHRADDGDNGYPADS